MQAQRRVERASVEIAEDEEVVADSDLEITAVGVVLDEPLVVLVLAPPAVLPGNDVLETDRDPAARRAELDPPGQGSTDRTDRTDDSEG